MSNSITNNLGIRSQLPITNIRLNKRGQLQYSVDGGVSFYNFDANINNGTINLFAAPLDDMDGDGTSDNIFETIKRIESKVQAVIDCGSVEDFKSLEKLEDYFYKITYNNALDEEYANKYFEDNYFSLGGCTSVRKGNYYGRNYDWYYDNGTEFVVTVPATQNRHASISICPGFGELNNSFVSSGKYSDLYKVVPFAVLDGINDSGIVCNINVVPAGDRGLTTGTTPLIENRKTLNTFTMLRFVLDNFDNATTAVNYLRDYCSIKMINMTENKIETHFMIADLEKTYIVEFIENAIEIIDVTDTRPYMTNFYIKDSVVDEETGLVDRTSLTPHGCGVERYELIMSKYDDLEDADDMFDLMHNDLRYTKAYSRDTDPYWFTEFTGNYSTFGDITVTTPEEEYQPIVDYVINEFENRSRFTRTTWQSLHSVVYDIENKSLKVVPQETDNEYEFSIV